MKEIKRWHLSIPTSDNPRTLGEIKQDDKGEYVLYLDRLNEVKQLQARIKELESQSHINEIKAVTHIRCTYSLDYNAEQAILTYIKDLQSSTKKQSTKHEKNN